MVATYAYDALGNRVEKVQGSNQVHYWYLTDDHVGVEWNQSSVWLDDYAYLNGQLLVEYEAGTTTFVHPDSLGSTRLMTGVTRAVVECDDYLPFGELLNYSGCSGSGGTSHKFTGKERDAESGLDYFGARYYGSNMGRFMSPDSTGYSGLTNPQSWNLYAYTLNNPLRYIDPSGHTVECTNEAAACLAAAQAAVGKDAAGQLTTKTTQNWFQKIFGTSTTTLQITGNEGDFRNASGNASKLADLIDSKTNFEVSIQQNTSPSGDGLGNKILGGGGFNMQGGSQAYTQSEGYLPSIFIDPRWQMDKVDSDSIRDHIPPPNMGEKFAHELLGHVWGEYFGGHSAVRDTSANGRDAVNAENEVRRTDPSRGQKTEHHHD